MLMTSSNLAQHFDLRHSPSRLDLAGMEAGGKARDGEMLKVKLADNAPVRAVVKAPLSDVKTGAFVGITAMPQPDGTQKAVEIHIFPETMRGTGEGHRDWDLAPNSTMTNATVATEVASDNGKTLVLKVQRRRENVRGAAERRGCYLRPRDRS
jgi:hypothetical protein